jgi:polar amino acid transport system substrate-binding protein
MIGSRWRAAIALLLALTGALPAGAQEPPVSAPPGVTIPNFSDPRSRIERPPAAAVPLIRFLTTGDFPPFNFLDDRGQLTGFNVDLARAICAELAIPCTIQVRAFDDLLGHLADKTADAVIAGIAITPDSRAQADFSDIYFRFPARFVVRKANLPMAVSPAALAGKTIAVVAGTAHEAYLAAVFPRAKARPYPSADAARAALKAGEVDALFGDGEQLSFYVQSDLCCAFAGGPYLDSHFFGEGAAIAVAKGAVDLTHALNAALQAVQAKGIYGDLYLRYFPVSFF